MSNGGGMRNKKSVLLAVFALIIYLLAQQGEDLARSLPEKSSGNNRILQTAFTKKQSDLQVEGRGVVRKILPDDLKGLRHQKFILQVNPGQTVLVAHNIDMAPRLNGLKKGDMVSFYGEYEWNERGGVIHWTHHSPDSGHISGWLKYNGRIYQ